MLLLLLLCAAVASLPPLVAGRILSFWPERGKSSPGGITASWKRPGPQDRGRRKTTVCTWRTWPA